MIGQFSLFAVLAVALVAEVASALAPAVAGEFPYQVSLRINGSHACSGAIIGYKFIVTAAKCVVDLQSKDELAIVTSSVSSTEGGVIYKARKINTHVNFNRKKPGHNDIAIIAVDRRIIYNDYQDKLSFPFSYTRGDVVANLTGWRWDTYNLPSKADYLKKIEVKTITTQQCQRYEPTVYIGQICASVESGHGSCVADTGAPLVYNNDLIGILSEGNPCGGGTPGVFTAIKHNIGFIYDNMPLINPDIDTYE